MPAEILFDGVTISASGSSTSDFVMLREGRNIHALQYRITGDGILDIKVETGSDKVDWINNGIKGNDLTKTSGPGGDGKNIIPLSLLPGDFIKAVATEVGTTDECVLHLWMVQK